MRKLGQTLVSCRTTKVPFSLSLCLLCFARGMDRKQSLRPARRRNPIQHFVWTGSDFTWTESLNEKAGARGMQKRALIHGPASLVLAAAALHLYGIKK